MEQITITLNNMEDVKREIDICQRKAVTSVVELGYILRKTNDTELYKQEGYSSIYKFAKEEYGWDASQTSRFMNINREFSVGGYSAELKEQYRGYGQSKLSEMLSLPEFVREELHPDMKREEIRNLKKELELATEENKKDAFEAAILNREPQPAFLRDSIRKLWELPDMVQKIPELFPHMVRKMKGEKIDEEAVRMIISATGFGTKRAGKAMYFFKKEGFNIVKGEEKKFYTYTDLLEEMNNIKNPADLTAAEWYQEVYGKELPGQQEQKNKELADQKAEVLPQEQKIVPAQTEKSTESIETSTPEEETRELPGQYEISKFAEKMPITYEKEADPQGKKTDNHSKPKKNKEIEPPQSIETSIPQTECGYCNGKEAFQSEDGKFMILLHRNGTGEIQYGTNKAAIIFEHCPKCGKELITDAATE